MSKSEFHHVALDNSRKLVYQLTTVFVPVTSRAAEALAAME